MLLCTAVFAQEGQREALEDNNFTGVKKETYATVFYKKGIVDSIVVQELMLPGVKKLTGSYKDGLPFNGYFTDEATGEMPVVYYYEQGVLVKHFSKKGLASQLEKVLKQKKELDEGVLRNPLLTEVATYSNGKIIDGFSYAEKEHTLFETHWSKGKATHIVFVVGAMHAAAVFRFDFLPDGYSLCFYKPLEEGNSYQLDVFKNTIVYTDSLKKNGNSTLWYNDKTLGQFSFLSQELTAKTAPLKTGRSRQYFLDPSDSTRLNVFDIFQMRLDTMLVERLSKNNQLNDADAVLGWVPFTPIKSGEDVLDGLVRSDDMLAAMFEVVPNVYGGTIVEKKTDGGFQYTLYDFDGKQKQAPVEVRTLHELVDQLVSIRD